MCILCQLLILMGTNTAGLKIDCGERYKFSYCQVLFLFPIYFDGKARFCWQQFGCWLLQKRLMTHSVIFRPILAKYSPVFGKLNNSVQSKDFFMISKVGSSTLIGLSCMTILRSNQASRMSSTTPGSEISDRGNLDQQNQRFSRHLLYKTCSK